jgi:hypothetical protein
MRIVIHCLLACLSANTACGATMRSISHSGDTWTTKHEAISLEISEANISLSIPASHGAHCAGYASSGGDLTLRTSEGPKGIAFTSAEKIVWSDDSTGTGSAVRVSEMTDHRFIGGNYRRQIGRFADGTTVEVDFDSDSYKITPRH